MNTCHGCGYEFPVGGVAPFQMQARGERKEYIFCEICANTPAGNAVVFHRADDVDVLKTIAWALNKIREDHRDAITDILTGIKEAKA